MSLEDVAERAPPVNLGLVASHNTRARSSAITLPDSKARSRFARLNSLILSIHPWVIADSRPATEFLKRAGGICGRNEHGTKLRSRRRSEGGADPILA